MMNPFCVPAIPGGRSGRRAALALAAALLGVTARAAVIEPIALPRPEGPRTVWRVRPEAPLRRGRPLVILLHGHGGSAAQLLGQGRVASPLSEWLAIADRDDLLLAVPDGLAGADHRQGWNDCRADAPDNPRSDDVGLVAAIIEREVRVDGADPQRVYLMGMSNGGMMALRAASELGSQLAAFAAVSAALPQHSQCPAPSVPLPALFIAGTADPLVHWDGGALGRRLNGQRGTLMSIAATVATWRQLDGLPQAPDHQVALPHLGAQDPTRATRIVWGRDPRGLQVEWLRIDGGGHVEPSRAHRVGRGYGALVGPQNGDLESAEEAWAFFKTRRAASARPRAPGGPASLATGQSE